MRLRKLQQAGELVAPVYDWSTEGFDTLDLKEAIALLAEVHSRQPISKRPLLGFDALDLIEVRALLDALASGRWALPC